MTTAHDPASIWLVVLAAGLGTYALRLSFILLLGRIETVPPRLIGVLRFVPAAVLAALVVPAIVALSVDPGVGIESDPAELVAGLVAAAVAWRTGSVVATIGVGMGTLWLLQVA